jgi:hypothetical protein
MNAMATIAARLQVLEALEGENARLWDFVDDVASVYEIADIQDVISKARQMQRLRAE